MGDKANKEALFSSLSFPTCTCTGREMHGVGAANQAASQRRAGQAEGHPCFVGAAEQEEGEKGHLWTLELVGIPYLLQAERGRQG